MRAVALKASSSHHRPADPHRSCNSTRPRQSTEKHLSAREAHPLGPWGSCFSICPWSQQGQSWLVLSPCILARQCCSAQIVPTPQRDIGLVKAMCQFTEGLANFQKGTCRPSVDLQRCKAPAFAALYAAWSCGTLTICADIEAVVMKLPMV